MAIFGMKVKSRRETSISGFHAEYLNDRTAIRQRKQMGYIRAMLSASSLLFGGGMIYVAFHYIPAFVHPKQVLKLATGEPPAMKTYDFDRKSQFHDVFGPYLKLFHLDRTYMRAGQTIDIKYDLPAGAYADLEIVRCQKAWVVEIFKCNVVSNYSTKTKRQRGVESFSLKVGGFYHFRQQVSGVPEGEPYRIVWERGL
jgi:hypothetical protein